VFVSKRSPASAPPLEALAKLYRLTASEIRMLDAVMKVSGVRALANLLGSSQGTVKTHLHNLFRKTGTARQSELVKLIAGFEPPSEPSRDVRSRDAFGAERAIYGRKHYQSELQSNPGCVETKL
jgi:DNA-binding CsgD family transcriptional regulator